jgi:D-glycero-D-manno-heptose 1,7-bisphosphate phosphatase
VTLSTVVDGRRAIFLDRDGTLTHPAHYPSRPSDLVLYDDVVPLLWQLQQRGILLVLVTNQSGIARGYFSEAEFRAAQASLEAQLSARGVRLDGVYHCPHHPDGRVPSLSVVCACRKPAPGMLWRAMRELGIDASRSWMIGDFASDVAAGWRAGCRTVWINRAGASAAEWPDATRRPDLVAASTADALARVLQVLQFDNPPRAS